MDDDCIRFEIQYTSTFSNAIDYESIILDCLISIVTNINDAIYRRLFEENGEDGKTVWCIVNYPPIIRYIRDGTGLVFSIPVTVPVESVRPDRTGR